jgi:hypothetical protein
MLALSYIKYNLNRLQWQYFFNYRQGVKEEKEPPGVECKNCGLVKVSRTVTPTARHG